MQCMHACFSYYVGGLLVEVSSRLVWCVVTMSYRLSVTIWNEASRCLLGGVSRTAR